MDTDTAESLSTSARNGPEGTPATDSIVLEEEIDPNYVPSEEEVIEYAKWLGMDLEKDKDLYWVAREGLMAPLPKNWKPCKTKDTEDIYYFNFSSGASTWDHPCDGYYKSLYEEEKKKKEISMKERNDQQRNKAKQDVEELLGKGEKKKKKKGTNLGDLNGPSKNLPVGPLGGLSSLERKPLPGINMQGLHAMHGMHGQAHLPRSWTESTSNVRDSISVISVRDSEDFKDSSDRDLFRTESSAGSPDRDSTDGKTRRRQRDSSSSMPAVADTLVTSRVVRSSDVSRRAASISLMEQERRGSISDKGRRGEVGPYKDGEFVNYSSESDSDSSSDCRSVRSVRSSLSPQDVPRKVLPNNSRFDNTETKSSELNKVRVADRGNDSTSEKDRERDRERGREKEREIERERERERSNISKSEWDRIPQERETIRRRSDNGNGIFSSAQSAAAAVNSERAGGASSREREKEREREDQTTYVEEFRNYSDDDTVDAPPIEKRSLLETRSGSRTRTFADEEKSGSGSSHNTMSSGNDLSLSDLAGMKKRSGTSGLLVTAGAAGYSGGRGNITTQEEHHEDMQAKRLLWQQEVDFHDSSVRRQRAAMIQEKERVEEEHAAIKLQKSSAQQSSQISRTTSDTPNSPNVTSDLRQKLRDLETEMDEMKGRNISLESEKNDALRAAKREKEAAVNIQNDFNRVESDLSKQLKSARAKANTLEEERNKLESDISLVRSELKKKISLDSETKIQGHGSTQGSVSTTSAGAGMGENGVSAAEREEEKNRLLASIKTLERELSREKESRATMTADFKAAEHTQEQQLKALKKELSAAIGHAESLRASLDTQSSSKGKDSAALGSRDQLEQKVKQLEALNKKFDDAQVESEEREASRISEKAVSDQRTRQLNEEIEQLTTSVESGFSKCRRAEQQLIFFQEDAADKEMRYQQARQISAALQKRCDEAESEVLVWRGKCKSDAMQSDVTVEDLTTQLAAMKAAKAVVESLLLSSGDDDDLERSELLAKISKLNIELAAERSAVADRDSLANSLKLEQAEVQKRNDLLEDAHSRVLALEAEVSQIDYQLQASQAELAAIITRTQNSDSTAKRAAGDLQQQITFLTASNTSLAERVEHKLAEVQSLSESMVQLQELLAVTEKNLEDSSFMSNELREHLDREISKTRLLQQVEGERDRLQKSFSSSEEHARGLEVKVAKLTADLSSAIGDIAAQTAAANAFDTSGLKEQLSEKSLKMENLTKKNSELESNIKFISERERTQSTALLSLQATHKKSLQEIESMKVRYRVTNSEEVEEKVKELNSLHSVINIERNQHQKVLSSLHEVLKTKEIEISTLKGDKVALVRLAEKTNSAPHTAPVDEGGIGIAALSAIVGQQQTSVQRLQEKLENTEGLILALTQALPSQVQVQARQSKPQAVPQAPQDSPKRVKKAAGAVSARGRRGGDADNDSEGESERKASSSADYHRYDKMTPSNMGNDMGRRGSDRELEKDLLLSPEWLSPSDSEVQRYPTQHRSSAKADMETRNSWSKIPTRHDTVGPSRSPTRSRPRQKEKDRDRDRERETPQTDIGLEIWALKIARENRFLDDLMATLKDEKLSVRKEQEVLGKRRAAWRMKKASNPKDGAGKAELRAESSDLNAQTTRLNAAVEQTRVMHGFLTERRRKLDALKEYLLQLSVSNESSQRARPKGAPVLYREDDAELTLEVMERLGRELDSEAEVTLHEYGYSSSADEFYVNSSSHSQVGQQDHQRGVRKSHSHDPSPAMHDRLYQQNLQTMAQSQNQNQNQNIGNQNQNHGQNINQMHSQSAQQYQQHPSVYLQAPIKGFYPPNQVHSSFDPRGDLLSYEHQYSQAGYSHPSSAYMQHRQGQGQGSSAGSGQSQHDDYYPASSSPPRMAVDDPARWAQPASSVRFNLGIKGINGGTSASFPYTDRGVNVGSKDPRAIRDQLKDLTNRRAQTTEAFDTHASWLNNLQAEIGRFSHGKGDRSDMPMKQKQQKTPSFTAFMASQGPAMCAEERFMTIPTDLEKEASQL